MCCEANRTGICCSYHLCSQCNTYPSMLRHAKLRKRHRTAYWKGEYLGCLELNRRNVAGAWHFHGNPEGKHQSHIFLSQSDVSLKAEPARQSVQRQISGAVVEVRCPTWTPHVKCFTVSHSQLLSLHLDLISVVIRERFPLQPYKSAPSQPTTPPEVRHGHPI